MTVSRRLFMSLMAAAPVAAGNASKAAVAKLDETAKASQRGILSSTNEFPVLRGPLSAPDDFKKTLADALKRGLPNWKRKLIREQTVVQHIDCDLMAARSISPSAKVWLQRERQIKAQERELLDDVFVNGWRKERESWLEKVNIPWW